MRMHLAVVAPALIAVAVVTGCAATASPQPNPTIRTTATTPATAEPADATVDPQPSGSSNGHNYTATLSTVAGTHGTARWTLKFYTLAGSDPVAAAVNRAGRASADSQLAANAPEADWPSGTCELDVNPEESLGFRPTAITEVLAGADYCTGAAHPNDSVSTIVIDTRTARPITLADLFVDEQAGLRRLSAQTAQLADFPTNPDGLAPTEANFGNWTPTVAGIVLRFHDYQFGHGIPSVTVPWSAVADLISPAQRALLP